MTTLRISRNSWHYWLYDFGTGETYHERVSLCLYFWTCVQGALKLLTLICCVSLVLGVFGYFLVVLYRSFRYYPRISFEVVGVLAPGVALLVGIRKLSSRFSQRREPTLLGAYWQARKDRVCPPVEFVD